MPRAATALTAAAVALILLVGLPVLFILLQAVFPDFARGSMADPFSELAALTENDRLLRQTRNTLLLAGSVTGPPRSHQAARPGLPENRRSRRP